MSFVPTTLLRVARRVALAGAVATLPVALAACGETGEGVLAPRSSADGARLVADEMVGVSANPPVRRAPPEFDDTDDSAVRLFHDVLLPYGEWSDDAHLGLVWIPSRDAVGDAFVPYATHGRWSHRVARNAAGVPVDDYVWLSDLPWGWVVFHYGRWAYSADRGWAWIAGRRYSGAWVDWRVPDAAADDDAVVGWGPMPPSHLWRISPGPRPTRARVLGARLDPRTALLVAVPYVAFSTPYAYVRARELFARDLASRLYSGPSALVVAQGTHPSTAPPPERLGIPAEDVTPPPAMDRGLQQAWMLATPASATAIGAGRELGPPPHLRTWVAGGPRWAVMR